MDPFNSPERRKSLTPDPSPKGEGSRIKDLKDLKGTTEKTEPLARRSQKNGKTEKLVFFIR
jgi:hypothetical protein